MLKSRKTIMLLILATLMIAGGLFAQEVMRITRKDKSTIDIPTSEIDKITFHGSAPQIQDDKLRDADGNVYKTVRIGNQVWMAENLRTTKFADGSPIPEVRDNDAWKNTTNPAMCWHKHDKANFGTIYGAFYNWEVVNSGRIAPPGWRVPTQEDIEELFEHLKSTYKTDIGYRLMTSQKGHWVNNRGSNETGFTGMPGYRKSDGAFYAGGGTSGNIWSSTINFSNASRARCLNLNYGGGATLGNGDRIEGQYIRFIKE